MSAWLDEDLGAVTGVERTQGHVTIHCAGAFDVASATLIDETGRAELGPGTEALTLDLGRVTLVDSSTVAGIVRLVRACQASGVLVDVIVRARIVLAVIRVTGLDRLVPVRVLDPVPTV